MNKFSSSFGEGGVNNFLVTLVLYYADFYFE